MWIRVLVGASVLLAVAALACGKEYGDGPTNNGPDAATPPPPSEGGVPIAEAGATRCDASKPFGAPVLVQGLPLNAACARFSEDESVITYVVGFDMPLRTATRISPNVYGAASAVVTAAANVGCATFTRDRTGIFYEADFAIWQEGGPNGGPYSARTKVEALNARYVSAPYLDYEHGLLYAGYHLEENYFNAIGIGVAPVQGGAVGKFTLLDLGYGEAGGYDAGKNEAGAPLVFQDLVPVISSDGLELIYATSRKKPDVPGDTDIWHVRRASLTAPFQNPAPLAEINSAFLDYPSWISPDGCRLYMHSARNSDPGLYPALYNVFVATRS